MIVIAAYPMQGVGNESRFSEGLAGPMNETRRVERSVGSEREREEYLSVMPKIERCDPIEESGEVQRVRK